PLSAEQRTSYVPIAIAAIVNQLETERPDEPTSALLSAGNQHGATRRKQGYLQEMLVDDIRILNTSIFETVQGALLRIDLSNLIPDLKQINAALASYLQESISAFNVGQAE